ncbi:MAG: replication-associated recombination protein A [Bacteroidetes bacterium]|nr:replication-associated recombination protein A [Bacteroidota bacterium]
MNHQVPLAERMRPQSLDDIVGQEHLTGPGKLLRISLESKRIPSMILWGPPGTGKTTLASTLSHSLQRPFYTLSAISAGVKDIREVIDRSKGQAGTILFIDEIHRFNKSQQDALLGAVERGWITLIGATTENPSFEVNAALLSRCQVYTLKSLEPESLKKLLQTAQEKDEWVASKNISLLEDEALLQLSGGDARKLLNLFELCLEQIAKEGALTNQLVMDTAKQYIARYDKSGEQHYDIISAFIKSIRGSDPNAAVYWLARMIEGGESISFIARRMIILASEDIGNANPTALILANNSFEAAEKIGYPEARIILGQCAVYLASSPKSNAAYLAIDEALNTVRNTGDQAVPLHLRNAPTHLMKKEGYGKDYQYAHSFPGNFIEQEFLPDALQGTRFYDPGKNRREEEIRQWLKNRWRDKYNY